jgi:membrane protein implicated in regulation of membrane protease activity
MNLWWVCVLAGVVFIGLEIVVPSFAVIWLGLAALVTAIPVYLNAPAWVDLSVFGTSLLLLTTFGRRLAITKLFKGARATHTNAQAVIGEFGIVIEKIDPISCTGTVRVGGEIWSAVSQQGDAIPAEAQIVVRDLKGVRLVVAEKETR